MKNPANRGRPVDQTKQDQQKLKLLNAAENLLIEKNYRTITIRELAEHAEINSAMIGYYFQNKEGLFIALLDKKSEQLFINVQQVFKTEDPLYSFIEMMVTNFTTNKGFAKLIHDEFLTNESHLGSAFMERFPKRMAQVLPKLIIEYTNIKDEKRAKYAAYSLMMLIISPFITAPVRTLAWNISDNEILDPLWIEHIYTLFIHGCCEEQN